MPYHDLEGMTDEQFLNAPPPEETGEFLSEETARALDLLVDEAIEDDEDVRFDQLRRWKELELYWRGIQTSVWDQIAKDWRTPQQIVEEYEGIQIDPADYERVINKFRANLEAIIAAVTVSVPGVHFLPDDADDADDITTAKAKTRGSKFVAKHNDGPLLWLEIVYKLANFGLVAIHNSNRQSAKFGVVKKPIEQEVSVPSLQSICPNCGGDLSQEPVMPADVTDPMADMMSEENQMLSDLGEPLVAEPVNEQVFCPDCQMPVEPVKHLGEETMMEQVDEEVEEKTREILSVYGPLNVKVPSYAKNQDECPYLILESEHHISFLRAWYPDIADKITAHSDRDDFDRWAREFEVGSHENVGTLRRVWMRPEFFHTLKRKDDANEDDCYRLEKEYPRGCCVVYVNDEMAEVRDESLDEHWTLSQDPTSDRIHPTSKGMTEKPIQDMYNEMGSLTLETIQHGIGENFVDSDAIDLESYRKSAAAPGALYPIKLSMGKTAANVFHTMKPATLSREVDTFYERLDREGQYTIGAVPAIWGGHTPGSKTLGEHESNKNMGLQRLGILYKMGVSVWTRMMKKAVTSFVKNLVGDDKIVEKQGDTYINIWIKTQELMGSAGECAPDASDQLPLSWAQQRTLLLELIGLNNEMINAAIFDPANTSTVARTMGFADLHIPGDDDRNKQLREIQELLKAGPIDPFHSSVPIEPDVDNIDVHVATLRWWANSEVGLYTKLTNPMGYENVLAHLREHLQFQAQQMATPPEEGGQGEQKGLNTAPAAAAGEPNVEI